MRYDYNEDKLDAEYAAYLDEYCKCDLTDDNCTCIKFEDWFLDKLENGCSIDLDDYTEIA